MSELAMPVVYLKQKFIGILRKKMKSSEVYVSQRYALTET